MRGILTYHSLDETGSVISIAPSVFRAHVAWLVSDKVRVVSIPDLLELDDRDHAVALTFDDAFANFADVAAPLLLAHGLPATLFVVSDHAGRDNRWRGAGDPGIPVLPLLGWDELRDLHASGFTIGAHTRTHVSLPSVSGAVADAELRAADARIEAETGTRPEGFAYPYGEVNTKVAALAATRYRWACTTHFAAVRHDGIPSRLPRLDAWYFRRPARLAGWGSAEFRAWVWARRQARRVRRMGRST